MIIMSNIWQRFEQVKAYIPTSRRLYRSSAPYYFSQKITEDAINFLKENEISVIISFNQDSYTADEITYLKNASITYHHFPVIDFQAATLEQLRDAYAVIDKLDSGTGVIVHCGYGHGRTGTGITGIQLQYTEGANPPEADWVKVNHVERPVQMAVLRELRDSYKVGSFRGLSS
jgi:protein-tyrosine phosphatase